MKAEIYTKGSCGYCVLAKELLSEYNIPYDEKVIGKDTTVEQLKELVPEAKTVPQIWLDNKHIGGYTELKDLLAAATVV